MAEVGNFHLKYAQSPNTPITIADKLLITPQFNGTKLCNILSNAYVYSCYYYSIKSFQQKKMG